MPQVQLNTRVSIEVFEALDKAVEKGISKAQIIDEALRMHPRVKKYLKEASPMKKLTCQNCGKEYDDVFDQEMFAVIGIDKLESDTNLCPECIEKRNNEVTVNGRQYDMRAVINLMDDELREEIHMDLAPCTDQMFVDEYCRRHLAKYGEEFQVN